MNARCASSVFRKYNVLLSVYFCNGGEMIILITDMWCGLVIGTLFTRTSPLHVELFNADLANVLLKLLVVDT